MKPEPIPLPGVLGSQSGLAACPDWKTPKHIHDQQEQAEVRQMTVEQAFPSSVHRLGCLKDRDGQLRQLLDYLQSLGIPMGSETWALRTLLTIRRLKAESEAATRVIWALNDKEVPDLMRMRQDYTHAKAMHAKDLPTIQTHCDWCGWPGARLIGEGNAACEDCLPTVK